jgi:diguanylate cyclase (GGDEF)-like protein
MAVMTKAGRDIDTSARDGLNREGAVGRVGRQLRVWVAVAMLVAVGGSTGAVLVARAQSSANAAKAREAFESSSVGVASGLKLAIQREQDLVVSVDGFVDMNPTASNTRFVQWSKAVRVLQRFPEIVLLAHVAIVPAAQLPAFEAAAVRDPAGTLSASGGFQLVPPGHRPFYCLATGITTRSVFAAYPAGYDFCAALPNSLASLSSGTSQYVPFQVAGSTLLVIVAPVYRGGLVPATVAKRRAAFLGWVGVAVEPDVLLGQALAGHPGTAVSFRYHSGSTNVPFHRGSAPRGAESATIYLHNGWTVRVLALAPATGLFAGGRPGALLVAGIALSLLLGILVFVLGTGRARARRLVTVKTGELRHQALHDGLTGLPNRALITDRVEQLLARSRRSGTAGAALFVDIDDFKQVNDTLGHQAGDQLLQGVGGRLTSGLREVDTVGRLGGDEFVVLIDGESEIAPELIAQRLLELMRQPFELECLPAPITITTSVGIAVGVRTTAGELLRDADTALYQAKAAGKNCYEAFRPEMQSALRRDLGIEIDLRSALGNDEFHLVYQPIYNLDDLSLVGVEALLRWQHPTLGLIQPNDFIPLLESSGRIREVGRWVLGMACQQMAAWHDLGSTLGVSVNVSARQLDDDAIVTDVRAALAISTLDPSVLTLEITETALMRNIDASARRLTEIKALGVNLAIDDFGTGYSSLASLKQLPIDTIKIDREFTGALARSPQSDVLIRTLVQLGKDLGLRTVAEGVETIDQLDQLRHEHVNDVQGFLLSRPLEAEAVQALILPELAPTPHTA